MKNSIRPLVALVWTRMFKIPAWGIHQYLHLRTGLVVYLTMVHGVHIWPGQEWYCRVTLLSIFMCFLWSTLLIVNMTFDRFYSIIKPHKAASFNTVKRAKITILIIVIVSFSYNIPHMFVADNVSWECLPYGGALGTVLGETYYWTSFGNSICITIYFVTNHE